MSQQCAPTYTQSDSLRQLQLENDELKKYLAAQKVVIASLERRVGRSLETLCVQVQKLATSPQKSAVWDGQLDLVQNEVNSLCDLISDTMLLQKLEAGKVKVKLESLDLQPVFTSVSRHLLEPKDGRSTRLVCEIEPSLPLVLADQELTEAVLLDLLARGMKYSDPDSSVVLETNQDAARLYIQITAQRFAPVGNRDFATEIVLCCRRIEVQGGEVTCQHYSDGLQTVTIALNLVSSADH